MFVFATSDFILCVKTVGVTYRRTYSRAGGVLSDEHFIKADNHEHVEFPDLRTLNILTH